MIIQRLIEDLTDFRGQTQLATGILGTKYLIQLLSRLDKNEIVYKLFNRTEYPGWGYMLNRGATTIWECWEYKQGSGMNSHDHPAFAAPDTWFYTELAGIKHRTGEQERRVFTIKPYFNDEIRYVKAHLNTPWGKVELHWEKTEQDIVLNLGLPANTTAEVILDPPGKRSFKLYVNKEAVSNHILKNNSDTRINIGSGFYIITLKFD